jgi:hypothetical protein
MRLVKVTLGRGEGRNPVNLCWHKEVVNVGEGDGRGAAVVARR